MKLTRGSINVASSSRSAAPKRVVLIMIRRCPGVPGYLAGLSDLPGGLSVRTERTAALPGAAGDITLRQIIRLSSLFQRC